MKKKGMKSGIIAAILLLAVGFAAVTTTLIITGVIKIVPDTEDFENNIIFTNATLDATSAADGESTATIGADTDGTAGKVITINTRALKTIGETIQVDYEVTNNSQYAAKFGDLTCTITNAQTENGLKDVDVTQYIKVTPANTLSATYTTADPLAPNGVATDSLTIQMIRSYAGIADPDDETSTGGTNGALTGNEEISITLSCTLPVDAVETTLSTTAAGA